MNAAKTAAALGDAREDGKDWRCRCPVCSNDNLTLSDGRRGLLIKCFNDCTSKAVRAELRRRGLNGAGNGNAPPEPESRAQHESRAATAAAKRKIRTDAALDIWRNSYPASQTLAETYLYSRLLMGAVPPALRLAASLWHKESGTRHPALIGLVEHADKGAVGIHAIFLNPLDATVRVTSEPRKKSLGPVSGGAVRLAPAGPTLAIAEGIEDALAFMQATNVPSWAAITAPGLRNFIPPPLGTTDTIILVEDQDANGTGQKAVADAARRLAHHAVELVALEHSFHPVKQFLDALAWDGTERLEYWLTDCLGVDKTEYAMAVGRMFLIGMVARIYQPGCQADYMLILEGKQGLKKSTACRILAGEWFSDSLTENVASKDAALHLRGKWLVEIAELHTFNRSETAALKAFITRREDIFRPPYGRKEVYRPRQNLFIGTTNKAVYLQDSTGARRFWPVLTTDIDVGLLGSIRDQLFAEAVDSYRRGEHWWPDSDFEATHMAPEQEARFEGDAWEPLIADYLARKPNFNLEHPNGRVTVLDVALNAVGLLKQDVGAVANARISAVLERKGWCRSRRTEAGRWWVPDGN